VNLITASRHGSLAAGAKWGLGVGGGFGGLLALMAFNGRCYGECAGLVIGASLVYAGVGAGVGVGISALTTSQHIIFAKSGASTAKVTVAPLVDDHRKGAMVSVKW
jgi:hypothetical protein